MKIASIDIGTNTCNLSIAEYLPEIGLKFIYKEKKVISLINRQFKDDMVSAESVLRLMSALRHYMEIIEGLKVDKTIAIATSGIRSAVNKDNIINAIEDILGIKVSVITGHNEAQFVYEGVKNAVNLGKDHVLIIDIGGGSLEFVICNEEGILCTYSFDIGSARLLYKQNFSDPLSEEDIINLNTILKKELHPLLEKSKEVKVKTLIGSSGSFETFVDLINYKIIFKKIDNLHTFAEMDINEFEEIYSQLINFNHKKRIKMPGMDIMRVKMIPVAAVMTKFLIDSLGIERLIQSKYSIKEGVIFDYINKNFEFQK